MQHIVGLSNDRRRELRLDEEMPTAMPFGVLRRRAFDLHHEHLANSVEYPLCSVLHVRAADILSRHDSIQIPSTADYISHTLLFLRLGGLSHAADHRT